MLPEYRCHEAFPAKQNGKSWVERVCLVHQEVFLSSAFLGKCASITAVDLMQPKKLGSWKFCESNLAEARFNFLVFY